MKTVYFIPTNRPIDKCLKSYIKEINFALEKFNLNVPIVINETNDLDFVKENKKVIDELKKQNPDIKIYHITTDIQKEYFDILFSGYSKSMKEIFESKMTNYGLAMNKIFLFTCSFDAEGFHRRDSDTYLIFDAFKDAKELYPIEPELKYLGCSINDIDDTKHDNDQIWVVGSNYFGEWNLDVKDFAKSSMEIVYHLYELLGFPAEHVKSICDDAFQFNKSLVQNEKLTIVTSVNDGLNPDCGNVAVYKLHEKIPALNARNNPAADYFQFDVSTALGIPSLHHTREIFHEYHSSRFNLSQKNKYWEGVCKLADYFNLYMSLFNSDLKSLYEIDSDDPINTETKGKIIKEIKSFSEIQFKERTERIKRIAEEVLIPFDDNYAQIGVNLLKKREELLNEATVEYDEHCELIEKWDDLIERAKNIYIPDLL